MIVLYLSADLGWTLILFPFSTLSSKSSPDTVTSNSFSGFILCTPATNIDGGLGDLLFAFTPPSSWPSSVSASNLFVVCGGGGFSQ
jgi:hypothetical protein